MVATSKNTTDGQSGLAAGENQPPHDPPPSAETPSVPSAGTSAATTATPLIGGPDLEAQNGQGDGSLPPHGDAQVRPDVQNGGQSSAFSTPPPYGVSGGVFAQQNMPPGIFLAPPVAYRASPLAAAQSIPTFTGDVESDNVEKFLLSLRTIAHLEFWTPDIIRAILVLKTDGSASNFVQSMSPEALSSLKAIEIAFCNRFKRKWSLDTLEQELFALRQGPQESVDRFFGRVTNLRTRLIESTDVPPALAAAQVRAMLDDRLLRAFITGLRGSLMRNVRGQRPSTLEQAKATALFEEESENLAIRLQFPPSEVTVAALHATTNDKLGQRVSRTQQLAAESEWGACRINSADARGTQNGALTPTRNEATAPTCYECGVMGHFAKMCPERICGRCMKSGHRPKFCPSLYSTVNQSKNVDLEGQ